MKRSSVTALVSCAAHFVFIEALISSLSAKGYYKIVTVVKFGEIEMIRGKLRQPSSCTSKRSGNIPQASDKELVPREPKVNMLSRLSTPA
jgi:hypothetical protein